MSKRYQKRSLGAVTVEVALCLPILMVILIGSYEMARANMMLHSTESAAYEGARVGIIPGATPETVEAAVSRILRTVGVGTFEVQITPEVLTPTTEEIEVFVTVPVRDNLAIPTLFLRNPVFTGSCTLKRELL